MDTEESNKGQVGLVVVIENVIIVTIRMSEIIIFIAVSITVFIIISSLLPIYITPCTCMRCVSKVGARITNDKIRRRTTPTTRKPRGKGSWASPGPGDDPRDGPSSIPDACPFANALTESSPGSDAGSSTGPVPSPCRCASIASRRAAAS